MIRKGINKMDDEIKRFLKKITKLEPRKGGYSHSVGDTDHYKPDYYDPGQIRTLKKKARNILKRYRSDEL